MVVMSVNRSLNLTKSKKKLGEALWLEDEVSVPDEYLESMVWISRHNVQLVPQKQISNKVFLHT